MAISEERTKSWTQSFKHAVFELLFNTYGAFSSSDIIQWLIVLVETIQLTFYPLRRTVPLLSHP